MTQVENVLVLESPGGSASTVYVFAFQKGKPRTVETFITKGTVWVKTDEDGNNAIITMTQYSRVPANGRSARLQDHIISVPIEYGDNQARHAE